MIDTPQKLRRLAIVLSLVEGFAIVEFIVAHVSSSLALTADSIHLVSDGLALAIALWATWMSRRALLLAAQTRQVEVWAALCNGLGLVGLAGWIGWEAIASLRTPLDELMSLPMLLTAVVGLAVNALNISLLHPHAHSDLNLRGAFLHVLADFASSIGVLFSAIAIGLWHWNWADRVVSLVVAIAIGAGALSLIRQSLQTLKRSQGLLPPDYCSASDFVEEDTSEVNPATTTERSPAPLLNLSMPPRLDELASRYPSD